MEYQDLKDYARKFKNIYDEYKVVSVGRKIDKYNKKISYLEAKLKTYKK